MHANARVVHDYLMAADHELYRQVCAEERALVDASDLDARRMASHYVHAAREEGICFTVDDVLALRASLLERQLLEGE